MKTASAIRPKALRSTRPSGTLPIHSHASRVPFCIGARKRAYATCHLAGSSTLIPRAGA